MYLGIVTGTVVASQKAAGLEGQKLLLVQPVDDGRRPVGDVQVACDVAQAGVGDLVTLVGSREAALALTPWFVPVDATIVGIVDDVHNPERAASAAGPERAASGAGPERAASGAGPERAAPSAGAAGERGTR